MIVIKDAMVFIHLAKLTLLELVCNYFGSVVMANEVFRETCGKEKHDDSLIIKDLISTGLIQVEKPLRNFVKKAQMFNLYRGEAETLALYWQLNADIIASDDDNLRKKQELFDLNLIGTPTLILKLYKRKKISKDKFTNSIKKLKEIGWFHPVILDTILMEA